MRDIIPRCWRRTSIIAALVCVTSMPVAIAAADVFVDAGRGPLLVRVPSAYAGEATPLVVLLHGYGGSGAGINTYFGLEPLAESAGFFYVTPDGTVDIFGSPFWNATDACCNLGGSDVDDVGYLIGLVDAIDAQLNVDPARIYFVGHSNGGFMSHRMACEHANRIAAIVSVAGATHHDPADCAASEPVHVLQIHGTSDGVIAYGGGAIWGMPYPGALTTTQRWATMAGCSLVPDLSAPPIDIDDARPGAETFPIRYPSGCSPTGSAELWSMSGSLHGPSWNASFAPMLVDYLFSHTKLGVVSAPIAAATTTLELAAHPNPFRSGTELRFGLARQARVSLTVFDVNGRRVKSLVGGERLLPGLHRARWDGTSDAGDRLGAGVYFVRIEAGTASRHRKVVLGR